MAQTFIKSPYLRLDGYGDPSWQARNSCLEDGFEYRVKKIFARLREEHKDEETDLPFTKWIEQNHKAVGVAFLDDVDSYMGMPLLENEESE